MAERVQSPFNLIKGPDGDPEFFVPASTIDERLLKLRRKIKALSSKDTKKLKRKAIQLLDRETGKLLSSSDMRFIQAEDPKPISGPIEINKDPSKGFNRFIGHLELKNNLRKDLIFPLVRLADDKKKLKVPVASGISISGPNGIGKRTLAQCLAEEIGAELVEINSISIIASKTGDIEERVSKIFEEARNRAKPTVIFYSDADIMLKKRQTGEHLRSHSELNANLAAITDPRNKGKVIVVLASTKPDLIDPNFFKSGCVEKEYVIDFNDSVQERVELLKWFLKDYPCEEDIDIKEVAEKIQIGIPAIIKQIVEEASKISAFEFNLDKISERALLEAVGKVAYPDKTTIEKQLLDRKTRIESMTENKPI